MVEALRAAIEDCDGAAARRPAPAGHGWSAAAQSLRVANPLSWHYINPGLPVAETLGIEPAELMVTTTGGNNPQSLVNATALAIGRGELDVAVLVGADCVYTQAAARRHPDRPVLPWTVAAGRHPRPVVFGNDRRGTTEAEEAAWARPAHPRLPPVRERPAGRGRPGAGRPPAPHRGQLWSRFSDVAAANPYAWLRDARSAEEIITAGDDNRMIAYPYTKLLTANMQVDQGAALIMCSAAAARSAGIARGPVGLPPVRRRRRRPLVPLPPGRLPLVPGHPAGRGLRPVLAGAAVDEVAHLDLYSCFPSAVEIAAAELGLAVDDPARPLTVTGGLPSAAVRATTTAPTPWPRWSAPCAPIPARSAW